MGELENWRAESVVRAVWVRKTGANMNRFAIEGADVDVVVARRVKALTEEVVRERMEADFDDGP